MGNPSLDSGPIAVADASVATIHNFYTSASWIEGVSVDQVGTVARIDGVSDIATFPDLHPGKFGPVGIAVKSRFIHPALIGNDIGCGMSVFRLDLPLRKLRIERASDRLRQLSMPWDGNAGEALTSVGLHPDTFPLSLGSIGGGNHFCELQAVEDIYQNGVVSGQDVILLVHSGSRGFGEDTFEALSHQNRFTLVPTYPTATAYMHAHDQCVNWAALNRRIVASRVAEILGCDVEFITDAPHNILEPLGADFLHRKGAAVAHPGDLVPIAGSRASVSYLVKALPGVEAAYDTVSHGSGRKHDRASMRHLVGKTRSEREALKRNAWGGVAICEDKNLLLEEASQAYKSAKTVVDDLASFGLVDPVAALRPLITFKRANLLNDEEDGRIRRDNNRRNERKARHV